MTVHQHSRKARKTSLIHCHPYLFLFIVAVGLTGISYISINTNSQIFDYSFHMARIVGLAQSIANRDFLPNLNFLFTHGSGYAVPMFYGNGLLYLPALVYLVTKMGTYAFATYAFLLIWATSWSSYYSFYQITQDKQRSLLFAVTMATVFPYFGFGMSVAAPFIPFIFYCLYKVLYLERLNPLPLGVAVALLVQTHIISTVVLGISCVLMLIFLAKKWTLKKFASFMGSAVIALIFSIGFIFQYLEQNHSQTFFVSWGLRDYPFPAQAILAADNLFNTVKNTATVNNFYAAFFFLLVALIAIKFLKPFGRALILTSLVLLLSSTNLLPWQSVLRFTFLTVFQYTTRLIYFLPAFVIMALFLSNKKYLVWATALVQLFFFVLTQPLAFLPHRAPYRERFGLAATNVEVMRHQNAQATASYIDPYHTTYWTSGDEYFNLVINHDQVQDGSINQFIYDESQVKIENIQQGYNRLEFDVVLSDTNKAAKIVLPRVWYKGYRAIYSDNASGSQPEIEYTDLTTEEIKQYAEAHKPKETKKALHNGQGTIVVDKGGHVTIRYQKTRMQFIGFVLEFLVWLVLIAYCGILFLKERKKSYENLIDCSSVL